MRSSPGLGRLRALVACVLFTSFGLLVGLLFWKTAGKSFDFGDQTANTVIKWLVIGSFAVGCGVLPTVRCVVMITLVTVLNVDGQSIVQCALMAKLADSVAQNLVGNFQRATRSVLCNIDVAKNITRTKVELMERPTQELMEDMLQGAARSGRIGDAMPKLVRGLEVELTRIAKGGEIEEIQQRANMVATEERAARKKKKNETDKQIDEDFKRRYENQVSRANRQRDEMLRKFVEKATYQCEDIVNGAVFLCKQWFLRKLHECLATAWSTVACIIYEFENLCLLFEVLDFRFQKCGSETTEIDKYAQSYGSQLTMADQWTKDLANEFNLNIQYKVHYPFRMPQLVTLEQMLTIVREAFGAIRQVLSFLVIVLTSIGFVFVLMAIHANFKWFKTYESDVTHENHYLTPAWWLINKRRKKDNRYTLLPLRRFEKKRVYNPVTLKPMPAERKQLLRGISKLCYLFIVAFSLIIMDGQFYQMLSAARRHAGFEVKQEGRHDIKVQIFGTGTVAKMVSSIIEDMDKSFTLDQKINNDHCVVVPTESNPNDVKFIWLMYTLLLVQSTLGVYLIRLRLVIASMVYPNRQRTRIIWLYNDMLRQRALFNRQRKIKINQMALEDDFPEQNWLDRLLNRMTCLWCNHKSRKMDKYCRQHGSKVYFCTFCWETEMNSQCAACLLSHEDIQNEDGRIKKPYINLGQSIQNTEKAA